MKIHLNEDTFNRVILREDKRADKAKEQSIKAIKDYFEKWRNTWPYPFDEWFDETFDHPSNNMGLSNMAWMYKAFEEFFFHDSKMRASQVIRLEPAIVKMAFEAGYQQQHRDSAKITRIRKIVDKMYSLSKTNEQEAKFIAKLPLDVSFDELNERYGSIIDAEDAQEYEKINNTDYKENHSYSIIGPLDFNTAHQFALKTGDMVTPSSRMCYGMYEDTWDEYLEEGKHSLYICLRDDYDQLEPVHDDESESGYDTYGLSMIWVIVDGDGNLCYSNTRWNHKAKYAPGRCVDQALSRSEISDIIGRNFMKTFIGNNSMDN